MVKATSSKGRKGLRVVSKKDSPERNNPQKRGSQKKDNNPWGIEPLINDLKEIIDLHNLPIYDFDYETHGKIITRTYTVRRQLETIRDRLNDGDALKERLRGVAPYDPVFKNKKKILEQLEDYENYIAKLKGRLRELSPDDPLLERQQEE